MFSPVTDPSNTVLPRTLIDMMSYNFGGLRFQVIYLCPRSSGRHRLKFRDCERSEASDELTTTLRSSAYHCASLCSLAGGFTPTPALQC